MRFNLKIIFILYAISFPVLLLAWSNPYKNRQELLVDLQACKIEAEMAVPITPVNSQPEATAAPKSKPEKCIYNDYTGQYECKKDPLEDLQETLDENQRRWDEGQRRLQQSMQTRDISIRQLYFESCMRKEGWSK